MKNRIITISREFGSGGRTIGKKAAEKLNIPCFYTDKKWGDARNYDVALDSGVIGLDKCVEIVKSLF